MNLAGRHCDEWAGKGYAFAVCTSADAVLRVAALWDGRPARTSIEHDTIYDEA